ncbi:UNVERIFIED_CONTAM: RagB/SusD family nutrient uptake outer membrane protein, partial [Bacteroidetes bacterium 56_B9]
VIRGAVSRAAGEHLLAKICLATGDFQQAVDATTRCINDYGLRLMTERFGINMDDKSKDVYNDLFQEENISIVENKEGIMIGQ